MDPLGCSFWVSLVHVSLLSPGGTVGQPIVPYVTLFHVMVLGTTNKKDEMDSAMLRRLPASHGPRRLLTTAARHHVCKRGENSAARAATGEACHVA